ncbi:hypothetical protein JCM10207_007933 [Rhodosporidiobolus poonsookiae]
MTGHPYPLDQLLVELPGAFRLAHAHKHESWWFPPSFDDKKVGRECRLWIESNFLKAVTSDQWERLPMQRKERVEAELSWLLEEIVAGRVTSLEHWHIHYLDWLGATFRGGPGGGGYVEAEPDPSPQVAKLMRENRGVWISGLPQSSSFLVTRRILSSAEH